jgi:hypothetical protein
MAADDDDWFQMWLCLSPQKRLVSILGVLNFKMYYGGYGGKWVAFKHYLLLDS